MTLLQLIAHLKDIYEEHGNLEVLIERGEQPEQRFVGILEREDVISPSSSRPGIPDNTITFT